EQLEFKPQLALLTGASVFMFPRSLMGGSRKVLVAASTAPTMGNDYALVGLREIVDQFAALEVVDDSADWNFEDDIVAGLAAAVGTFAVASALRVVLRIEAEVHKRVGRLATLHDDAV